MPRRRRGRDIHGILPLDKPSGLTSNAALQRVRRLLDARKAGHTGSLDPMATGVLPLCFGEATKVSAFLLDTNKTYEFTCCLGQRTDTGDAEGEVIDQMAIPRLDDAQIETAISRFRGDIEQVPPMYSALKHEGQRLYRLAREGREVERPPRPVHIEELTLQGRDDSNLQLRVRCSKGTYVRVLAEDLASALGSCGHVTRLRRVAAGPFTEDQLVDSRAVEAAAEEGRDALLALLRPVDVALAHWPSVSLSSDAAHYFKQGQAVMASRVPTEGDFRVYGADDAFLGIGRVLDDGRIRVRRLILANQGESPIPCG